jgi:ubiquitin-like modifier-activating enzyme ATG7
MVQKACEDSKYLERVTGLDKMFEETEKLMEGMMESMDVGEEEEGDDF